MNDPNLNPNPVSAGPKERFDLKKHVHQQGPFFTGVKMFVSVVVSLAALSVALLGGIYLLLAGPPPDFYQKAVEEAKEGGNENVLTPAQEKSLQETITELFNEYRRAINEGGKFPLDMAVAGFVSTDRVGKSESAPNQREGRPLTIKAIKLLSYSNTGPDSGVANVQEVTTYSSTFKDWFSNAGGTRYQGDILLEERIEYEYRLVKQGTWKLASRKVSRASPVLVQQADEASRTWLTSEDDAVFDDSRPSKESLTSNYQRIAQGFQNGYLSYSEFPSGYTVQTDDRTLTLSDLQTRFQRLLQNAVISRSEFTIESVDQTGLNTAEATVKFEIEFVPKDSTRGNHYVGVWRDVDKWTRDTETSKDWRRVSSIRIMSSPILQHYEGKTPPPEPNQGLPSGE